MTLLTQSEFENIKNETEEQEEERVQSRPRCPERLRPPCWRPKSEPAFAWVVLGAAVVSNMTLVLVELVFSMAYRRIGARYGSTMGQVGWIRAAWSVSLYACGVVMSPAIEYFGCRWVGVASGLLTAVSVAAAPFLQSLLGFGFFYGILCGVGSGGLFFTTCYIIQLHFDENRGLATGAAALGFSASNVLAPIIIETLLDTYGLLGGLLLCGGIIAHSCVAAMFFLNPRPISRDLTTYRTRDHSVSNHHANDTDCSNTHPRSKRSKLAKVKRVVFNICDPKLLRDPFFLGFCAFGLLASIGYEVMYSQGPNRLKEVGASSVQAAYLMSVIGVANVVLRIITSVMMNFKWRNEMMYTAVGVACGAVGALLLALARDYRMCLLAMISFGAYEGITNTVRSLLLVYIVGVTMFNRANSLYHLLLVPVSLVSPPLTGYLYDIYGSYTYGFYGSAAMCGVSLIILICMTVRHANSSNKRDNVDGDNVEAKSMME